jgi:HEAT repeat protein
VEDQWVELLEMAKDRGVDEDVRSSALFWVGQEAAEAATEGLADVAFDEDEDHDVREAAIFALSQRSPDEGVPVLMELARTAEQADTRESAMFWLAQSEDPRVFDFFEEILLRRGGGLK